jgi:tetratricopeptide (TPR) repeat protein
MYRRLRALWLSLPLLALAGAAQAANTDDWEAGQQAFRERDYDSALFYFQSARDAGLDSPAVHYNIAVSQFKLGRFEEAAQTFALIARRFPQMRGLAEYNLGLVARRLGDTADARAHFLRAYELSPDDRRLRVLSSRRLREIVPETRTASRWTGAVGVRAGQDDNVALRDEAGLPVGTTTESPMVDLFAMVKGPWDGRSGFRLDGSAYLVRYFDADEFDQSNVRGGVLYDWRPVNWRIQAGLHASAGTLGGDAFDRKVGLDASATRYLGDNVSIALQYVHDDVSDADSRFAGIAGTRHQLDAHYRWYADGHRLRIRAGFEANDRTDPGVSPDRLQVGFRYDYRTETGIGYGGGIEFRNSDYGELAAPREEDLLTLSAGLTYTLQRDWQFLFEFRHSDNDSTDATFSYDRSQLTFGAMKFF